MSDLLHLAPPPSQFAPPEPEGATTVTTTRLPEGRLVVFKRAGGPDGSRRLLREATVLGAVRHPGVVELLDVHDTHRGIVLELDHAGSRSLAELRATPYDQLLEVLAAVIATVADLHDRGVAHGDLRAEHVVVGSEGRATLCSFGRSRLPGDTSGPSPGDDVTALGEMLLGLLAAAPDADSGLADPRRLGPLHASHRAHQALRSLAELATTGEPSHRPSARELADGVAAVAADMSQGRRGGRWTRPRNRPRAGHSRDRRRLNTVVGSAAAVVVITVVAWSFLADPGPAPLTSEGTGQPGALTATEASDPGSPATGSDSSGSQHGSTSITGAAHAGAAGSPPAMGAGASPITTPAGVREPVDGQAPGAAAAGVVASTGGAGIEHDGQRWAVGQPGDQVVVADWSWGCDGIATPALLRPATGEVFAFDRWTDDQTVEPFTTVSGATTLEGRPSGSDGCHDLAAIAADGTLIAQVAP